MSDDLMRYDRLVEDALRSVVKRALVEVIEHGLPGDHHFYITFRTEAPGVAIPDELHATYPNEMTIVLQHQFWDLEVGETYFSVVLSFNNVRQELVVPFEAVVAFADPSVRFGLQFEYVEDDEEAEGEDGETAAPEQSANEGDGEGPQEATIITLDSFRKK